MPQSEEMQKKEDEIIEAIYGWRKKYEHFTCEGNREKLKECENGQTNNL